MNRINIWQCKDYCCDGRPYSDKWWFARSQDFDLYEQVTSWKLALLLSAKYIKDKA